MSVDPISSDNNRKPGHSRKLTVVPCGGLANRMRAIASGIALADSTNRELQVVWNANSDLNAPFNLLFNDTNLPFGIKTPNRLSYHIFFEGPRLKNFFLPKLISKLKGTLIWNITEDLTNEKVLNIVDGHNGDVIINSGLQFYDFKPEILWGNLTFSERVLSRKESILMNRKPDVTVQIRRTDNWISIDNSPLQLFEDKISELLLANPHTEIFLATDDNETKTYLTDRFPGNIIVNRNEATRKTPEGMIDAAAEFLIMSQSDRIYGSYWSSFSEIAAVYGDTTLEVVKLT